MISPAAIIFKHCFNAFPAGNKKGKDLWQIKFAEDNFADKIDDYFRPFWGIQVFPKTFLLQFYTKTEGNVFINCDQLAT